MTRRWNRETVATRDLMIEKTRGLEPQLGASALHLLGESNRGNMAADRKLLEACEVSGVRRI